MVRLIYKENISRLVVAEGEVDIEFVTDKSKDQSTTLNCEHYEYGYPTDTEIPLTKEDAQSIIEFLKYSFEME